ncbi:MAG TPA: hypothetical protein VNE58_03915 [Casimicrobiaceae bacterium]|nr:hypothetical protein [Casimicrobiaceae bacterium]
MRWKALAIAAVATSFIASNAKADPCTSASSFADIAQSDFFCTNAEWLKNRGITLGCNQAGTLYCPGDVVTRGTMAAFMNRLGVALTPLRLGLQGGIAPVTLAAPPGASFVPVCVTATQAAVNYPRSAQATSHIAVTSSGSQLSLFSVMSLNGAAFGNLNGTFNVSNANGERSMSWGSNVATIPAGSTAQFAVGIANTGTGSLSVTGGQCSIEVEIANSNPTTPPFDQ